MPENNNENNHYQPDQLRNGISQNQPEQTSNQPLFNEDWEQFKQSLPSSSSSEVKCFQCGKAIKQKEGERLQLYCDSCLDKKLKNNLPHLQTKCQKQAEKWWFGLKNKERKQIEQAGDIKQLEEIWQKVKQRRNFLPHLICLAFFVLIFFGWDKFWIWYESPLSKEWDLDEDEKVDNEEVIIKNEPEAQETPQPKTKWEKVKNCLLDNKMKTLCLIFGIITFGFLIAKVAEIIRKS